MIAGMTFDYQHGPERVHWAFLGDIDAREVNNDLLLADHRRRKSWNTRKACELLVLRKCHTRAALLMHYWQLLVFLSSLLPSRFSGEMTQPYLSRGPLVRLSNSLSQMADAQPTSFYSVQKQCQIRSLSMTMEPQNLNERRQRCVLIHTNISCFDVPSFRYIYYERFFLALQMASERRAQDWTVKTKTASLEG